MTGRTRPPFRADHVGSFLRPKALLDARDKNKNGSLSREELRKVEDAAIRDVVRFQEDLGLKFLLFCPCPWHSMWRSPTS